MCIELGLIHVFETLTLAHLKIALFSLEVLNWLESPNCQPERHYDPKFHIQNADAMQDVRSRILGAQ